MLHSRPPRAQHGSLAARLALLAPLALPAQDDAQRAEALLDAGRFVEGRALLEPLVERQPEDARLRCLLAFANVSLLDADAALLHAEAAARLEPAWAAPAYHRGRALLLRLDFAGAGEALARAEANDPAFFPRWRSHLQALAALGGGDEARALQLYAASPDLDSPLADPCFLFERMGQLHPIVPDPAAARAWYRRAAAIYFDERSPRGAPEPFTVAPPVRGEWRVVQGNFGDESHFGIAASFGLDLMRVVDGSLERAHGSGRERFATWDEPVHAPAAATVVRAVDGHEDHHAHAGDLSPLSRPEVRGAHFGNHVVLELAPVCFLLLAHLRRGSLTVEAGARVAAGERLGRIGTSGTTWAPHLHLTLCSSLEPMVGRPLRFEGATWRRTSGSVERGEPFLPSRGDSVIAPR